MVGGKRRTISVENLVIVYPPYRISKLFTNRDYPWHLYILHIPKRDTFTYSYLSTGKMDSHLSKMDSYLSGKIDSHLSKMDNQLRHVTKKKCISFKYNGLTCKVDGNTDNIRIRYGDAKITVLFDRVMTIEEIAHFLESKIMPNIVGIKRAIRSGVEVIRGELEIISRIKRAM